MINQKSIEEVRKSNFGNNFVKPLYDSYCYSQIPQTIINLLTKNRQGGLPKDVLEDIPREYDKVILILIDGLGWNNFDKYCKNYNFTKHLTNNGVISMITSQYPSTTAAEITTINTNQQVCEHGIYEWFYYEPEVDAIIAPLLFSYAKDEARGTLTASGIKLNKIFPKNSFYKHLGKDGIKSFIFQPSLFSDSPYTNHIFEPAVKIGYESLEDGLNTLRKCVLSEKSKSYFYFYFGEFDSFLHSHGSSAKGAKKILDNLFENLEVFYKSISKSEKTLIIITSDHGQSNINPEETIYLNEKFPQIKKLIKKNKKGEYLAPAGQCRDMYLYIKEEYFEEAFIFLTKALRNDAAVFKTNDLLKKGFYGNKKVSSIFLKRLGNIALVCYEGKSVWWYKKGEFEQNYHGHHGSLTRDEMEIPFLCIPIE